MTRIAVIDIGTVTCRLLIAEVCDDSITELERCCNITNLGIGVDKTGVLQPDAIDRVVNQVSEYYELIKRYSITEEDSEKVDSATIPIFAFATSASRDAKNSDELVSRLRAIGVELSVISGSKEASLSFKGASSCFVNEILLVVDIGGGSTEVIFGEAGKTPYGGRSFNIGCRRITERFLYSDPPTCEELDAAKEFIMLSLRPFIELSLGQLPKSLDRVVAVAGTATSVVSIDKKMVEYNSEEVHKTCVSIEALEQIYSELASKPLVERKKTIGLEPQRASVIVAGMLILICILELCGKRSFTVSELDILHGIVLEESDHYLV